MATELFQTITHLTSNGAAKSEIGGKQLTLALGGLYIASTTNAAKPLLVWEEEKGYARYYIPTESLHDSIKALLAESPSTNGHAGPKVKLVNVETLTSKGGEPQALIERLTVGSKSTTWARFVDGPFKDFIRFERNEIDDWFENGALFAGIKNPYKRIDTAAVSHHIVVKIDGEKVAESNVAVLLNETGLKESYYLPATSILDWGAVTKSDLRTACPYKGEAWYLSLTVGGKRHENYVWYYQYPTHESAALQGLVSFYNKENVDILVDGVKI
ncbi:hypothetical protein D0Z07_5033 [Hyphodiscus hymeniophilus]|uniref:DUF427 domain-containing protein n=1 Tax=Hyphodiscus hymeniophilus TaxID=353542 RepID=A0A9P6VJ88_9HELO|nr:hypothetical protein D0Z07_5033 [Hyphodiscus hymeniophilus]